MFTFLEVSWSNWGMGIFIYEILPSLQKFSYCWLLMPKEEKKKNVREVETDSCQECVNIETRREHLPLFPCGSVMNVFLDKQTKANRKSLIISSLQNGKSKVQITKIPGVFLDISRIIARRWPPGKKLPPPNHLL